MDGFDNEFLDGPGCYIRSTIKGIGTPPHTYINTPLEVRHLTTVKNPLSPTLSVYTWTYYIGRAGDPQIDDFFYVDLPICQDYLVNSDFEVDVSDGGAIIPEPLGILI